MPHYRIPALHPAFSSVPGGLRVVPLASPYKRRALLPAVTRVLGLSLLALAVSNGLPAGISAPASAGEVAGGLPNLVGQWDVLKAKKQGKGRRTKYILSASPRLE